MSGRWDLGRFFVREVVMGEGPTLMELKREENRQLELLEEFPGLEGLAEGWEPGKYAKPTGKILATDEERCERVVELVLRGESDRTIAKVLGIGRNSINAVMRTLEARGKLEPLKERMIRDCRRVAMLSLQRMKEALEDDVVPPAALPIYAGVAIDKGELLAGGVTQRVEAREVIDVEGSFKALKELAARRALERGSMGKGAIGGGLGTIIEVDTGRDTGSGCPGQGSEAGAGAVGADQGAGGGGGVGVLGGGLDGNGLAGGNLSGKGESTGS